MRHQVSSFYNELGWNLVVGRMDDKTRNSKENSVDGSVYVLLLLDLVQ